MGENETIRNHAAFIWSVADLLRGDYKRSEYGKVILPLTVIRRLDCVLEPTKQAVLEKLNQLAGRIENVEPVLQAVAGQQFYNTSPLTFTKLLDDPNTIADALHLYVGGFSASARDIIDKFDFGIQIDRLHTANVLYQGHRQVRRDRPPPGGGVEHRDGLPLRGANPSARPTPGCRPPGIDHRRFVQTACRGASSAEHRPTKPRSGREGRARPSHEPGACADSCR
jgi:HsdM N-terminal domain